MLSKVKLLFQIDTIKTKKISVNSEEKFNDGNSKWECFSHLLNSFLQEKQAKAELDSASVTNLSTLSTISSSDIEELDGNFGSVPSIEFVEQWGVIMQKNHY